MTRPRRADHHHLRLFFHLAPTLVSLSATLPQHWNMFCQIIEILTVNTEILKSLRQQTLAGAASATSSEYLMIIFLCYLDSPHLISEGNISSTVRTLQQTSANKIYLICVATHPQTSPVRK